MLLSWFTLLHIRTRRRVISYGIRYAHVIITIDVVAVIVYTLIVVIYLEILPMVKCTLANIIHVSVGLYNFVCSPLCCFKEVVPSLLLGRHEVELFQYLSHLSDLRKLCFRSTTLQYREL